MLRIRNLKCFYGRIMAIKGISLSVNAGEITCLIGANGSGKSTLLSAVCGLLPDWTGEIELKGQSIKGLDPPALVRRGISLVPEGRLIFPPLSVMDNLKLGAYTRYKKKAAGAVEEDLESMMSLFPILRERFRQPAGTLSGGEQQMLAIARALMARPRLLLLDEPSMGLAPMIVEKIMEVLEVLRSGGLTIVLVEQNALAALEAADRGYVLETGAVVLQGAADELLADKDVKRAYLGKDYGDFYDAG
ncbi:MAG: ABC transporter ATP-binding protein [Desulfobacterales bacterium]|nr:ABC transporter ATP-binding protein [Desulfobacterales bacterium]MBS3754165.1 ABC transporter ATP-binding protein [Desulfobacterales bacterium]